MNRRFLIFWVILWGTGLWGWAQGEDDFHRELRLIRRAFLDVTGLLPTREEIEWFTVYNTEGYRVAVEDLVHTRGGEGRGWTVQRLTSEVYREAPAVELEAGVLERNVVYLSGLWKKGEYRQEWFPAGREKFIRDALVVADDKVGGAIDYIITCLACRPATAAEENELVGIYNKVILKSDEKAAWETVLLHAFQVPDCRTK